MGSLEESFAQQGSSEVLFTTNSIDGVSTVSSSGSNAAADIIANLQKKHPMYDEFKTEWEFFLNSYEGGEDFIEHNIFKHTRENPQDYKDRVSRAVYFNYVQPLVSFFSNFIFSEEIQRSGGSHTEQYANFIKDVDKKGNKIDIFMREVSDLCQIFGHIDILVDKKELPDGLKDRTLTVLDEQELGLDKPYFLVLYPFEVYDWKMEEGKFIYLKRCIVEGHLEYYTEWYPTHIVKTILEKSKNGTLTIRNAELLPNVLGLVPIVRSYYKTSKKYPEMGLSFLKDIAAISRRIMNLSSLLDEFLYRQCVTGNTLIDCERDLQLYPNGVPIEELVGKTTNVLSWNADKCSFEIKHAFDIRCTSKSQEVTRVAFSYKDRSGYVKFGELDATLEHPILTTGGKYTLVKDLKVGTALVGPSWFQNLEVIGVTSIGRAKVYNMEVEDNHNFIANGIVVHNCYNFLAKETDASIPFKDQTQGDLGTSNVMEYPRGAQVPSYVSPPVDPAQFLQSEREKNVLEIYRIASQDTALEIFTGQSRSGDAQSQSFHKIVPFISSRAENLEQTEILLMKLWLKWVDPTFVWDGKVAYKDDYGILNITNFLIQMKMLFSDIGIPSTTFIKEELFRVVQEFDGKIPPDKLQIILKEIDEKVTDEFVEKLNSTAPGSSNLKGVPGTAQIQQGMVQETLGNNVSISGMGADNVGPRKNKKRGTTKDASDSKRDDE